MVTLDKNGTIIKQNVEEDVRAVVLFGKVAAKRERLVHRQLTDVIKNPEPVIGPAVKIRDGQIVRNGLSG